MIFKSKFSDKAPRESAIIFRRYTSEFPVNTLQNQLTVVSTPEELALFMRFGIIQACDRRTDRHRAIARAVLA